MRMLAVVVLALVGAGCSETLPLHGDVAFTAEERADIERGNEWLAERVGRDPIDIVWDAPHNADAAACEVLVIHRTTGKGGENRGNGCVVLGASTTAAFFPALAVHELGHWRHLGHVTSGVMQPLFRAELAWTDEDQIECERVGVCDH